MRKIKQLFITFSFLLFLGTSTPLYSQCSMCRAVAEAGAKDDKTKIARGLNSGILYLLAMPYIIGGVGYFIWRKNRRKQTQVQ